MKSKTYPKSIDFVQRGKEERSKYFRAFFLYCVLDFCVVAGEIFFYSCLLTPFPEEKD